ncbi:four-carbon acid sugar kinase family protein [Mycolicibacterium sp. Y3]
MSAPIVVLADDLSGAAETAAVFLDRQTSVALQLAPGQPAGPGVTVIDLNTRTMSAPDTRRAHRDALATVAPDAMVFKKIDSLLRGHIGTEVAVLAERGPVTVAAALPALGRTVIGGVLHIDGVPLHRTVAWAAETSTPPSTVTELFGAGIVVCDAATDADLDAVLRNAAPGTQFVGTAALAAAVARTLAPGTPQPPPYRDPSGLLAVIGTAEPKAAEQVRRLIEHGFGHLPIAAAALVNGSADPGRLVLALDSGPVVLTIDGEVRPGQARDLSAALGKLVAQGQFQHQPDLILTGGETARAVIDAIGLTELRPVHQVHHGAVVSVASDGRNVATRPGSFGDHDSLVAIADHLTPHVHPQPKDKS